MFQRTHSNAKSRPDQLRPMGVAKSRMTLSIVLFLLFGAASMALAQGTGTGSALANWLGVDLIKMLRETDPLGKLCLLILAGFSVMSWTVIVYKYFHVRQAMRQTDAFVQICNQSTGQLDEAFRIAADFPDSPLAQILREGYLELEIENWYREGYNLEHDARIELAKVGIERVLERTISNEVTHLESKVVFLATTTNVCPFIGLFGTVWGIMGAFQAMSAVGGGTMGALAPMLGTALTATIAGLFCAIPASVMYNYLTNRISILTARMDEFALELSNVIQKQIIKQTT